MEKNTYRKGKQGEDCAANALEKNGISVIARNFRSKEGEIDLIGIEGETIVFIEVKSWEKYGIDSLEYSLNKKKLKRIIETAKYFLQKHRKYSCMAVRFDIVFIGQDDVIHITSAWTENL